MSEQPTARVVRCPTCQGASAYGPGNPWRPFCSERCRSADLGAWASERFRLPAEHPPEPGEVDTGPHGAHGDGRRH